MRQILVDVTRTHDSELHTGIQRVVRGLFAGLRSCTATQRPWRVLPAVFDHQSWYTLDHLPEHPLAIDQTHSQSRPVVRRRAVVESQDVLLMADASWYLDPWAATDSFVAQGGLLCGMVHDLLPLQHGEWFRPGLGAAFASHLDALARRAALLFVPSRHISAGLAAHLSLHHPPNSIPHLRVLEHGSDLGFLPPCLDARQQSQQGKAEHLITGDFDLVVATIEPRKNHALILDAFDQLWARGHTRQLVLVGAAGWQVEPLLARIHNHPERGCRLHWFAELPDRALLELYREAHALIYLSHDEGFGLPVLEARQLGCPVIASNIPVLVEVGQGWPTYIDPTDIEALVAALLAPAGRRTCAALQRRSWHTVASELISHIESCAAGPLLGLQS